MDQRYVIYISLIFLHIILCNSIYPQTKTPQDTTAQPTTKNLDISKTIKKMIEKHFSNQDTSKVEKLLFDQKEKIEEKTGPIENEMEPVKIDTATAKVDSVEETQLYVDSLLADPSIIINNDEIYTKSKKVKLDLSFPSSIGMKVSNIEEFAQEEWMPPTSELEWVLPKGNGYKRIYFKLLYADSSESDIYYDEIILDMTPPIAKFTVTPDTGIAGETLFKFDASESHHNFDLFLRWDWENDGQFDTYWNISKEEVHKFPEGGGKRKVKLEVKDSGGWHVTTTREVVVYSRPQTMFEYSQNFQNPRQFTFDASSSFDYEDGKNLEVRWDFDGDNRWDTGWTSDKIFSHDYDDFKYKTVRLEVKDSQDIRNVINQTIENKYYNMVFIPAGDFIMGSDSFEIDERPKHTIFVQDFWIDKYPITNKQYADFLNSYKDKKIDQLINFSSSDLKIYLRDSIYVAYKGFENHPVVQVTWHGAQAYAQFYNKSLPTEAEWEKTARGDDGRLYPWGNELSASQANYWDSGDPFDNNTTPVGFFDGKNSTGFQTANSPSPYGIYDLVDNVREWCNDWYRRDYYAVTPFKDPTGPESGTKRVVKGGGYLFHPKTLRASFRSSYNPNSTISYIGFRCVIRK